MALTPSNMLALGTTAPDFTLLDTVSGEQKSLSELKSDTATVIMFICNHCPFVVHIREALVKTANTYQAQGVNFIAISANDANEYPADGPDKMRELAQELQFPFVYLYDETQSVAKSYHAACTPDFYVFDDQLHCVYRGRYDGSTPGNNQPITGRDLHAALDEIINHQPVSEQQHPSMGCNIKWKEQ